MVAELKTFGVDSACHPSELRKNEYQCTGRGAQYQLHSHTTRNGSYLAAKQSCARTELLDSLSFQPEVVKVSSNLDSAFATGLDGISSRVLKQFSAVLAFPLSLCPFTLPFTIGNLPSAWKSANIT